MSKAVCVCSRVPLPATIKKNISETCKILNPDNIKSIEPKTYNDEHVAYGITNPIDAINEFNGSFYLGELYQDKTEWYKPSKGLMDGSYAMFRHSTNLFQIISDPAGSRTIWYYFDKELLISSTSQRAIIALLGSFEFNNKVIPWVLSTGTPGPGLSWDKRIKQLSPDSAVTLDKSSWTLSYQSNSRDFKVSNYSNEEHFEKLKSVLFDTFSQLKLDFSNWILPLSGGYDSRGILCLLRETSINFKRLKTVTWGLQTSLFQPGNDAFLAAELSKTMNVSHKYYTTDISDEPVSKIVSQFLTLGEGRIDHIGGYMDGFRIWKDLFEDGVKGIIRGDEGFGFFQLSTAKSIRHTINCGLCEDYANLTNYREFGFPEQVMPDTLIRQKGESLATWRDKVYHEFRMPVIHPALSDLKLAYVEIINPLFSRKILQVVRMLPDHLRTNKFLFTKIVNLLSPNVDYAKDIAIGSLGNILKQKDFVEIIVEELSSEQAKSILPEEFLNQVLQDIKTEKQIESVKPKPADITKLASKLKSMIPSHIKITIRDMIIPLKLDSNVLAFRVFIISRMNEMLKVDAKRRLSLLSKPSENGVEEKELSVTSL